EGRPERFAEIATEFVNSNVDVIVTGGNAVSAVRQATSTIPIVFALAVDPVGSGFVNSLSRPGGNVTGLSSQGPDLAGKRLELLRELAPGRRRLAILVNVGYPAAKEELAQVQTAARTRVHRRGAVLSRHGRLGYHLLHLVQYAVCILP